MIINGLNKHLTNIFMDNKQRKLLSISCKIEKILCSIGVTNFFKVMNCYSLDMTIQQSKLTWNFIEPLTDLTKKENINFEFFHENDKFRLKIW